MRLDRCLQRGLGAVRVDHGHDDPELAAVASPRGGRLTAGHGQSCVADRHLGEARGVSQLDRQDSVLDAG